MECTRRVRDEIISRFKNLGNLKNFSPLNAGNFDARLRNNKPVALHPIHIKRTTCPVFT